MERPNIQKFLFALVLIIGSFFRLINSNWDQGNHLHPDERFLTMTGTTISLPGSFTEYIQTAKNPLNPYNYQDYKFFVYGTFPLWLTKLLAVIFHYDTYGKFNLLGRILSAFSDILCLFFIYKIAEKIRPKLGLLASLFYAFCILPIQLSHFFAVDTFLNFFLLGTFYFLSQKKVFYAAVFYSLALSSKISGVIFLPVVLVFLIVNSNFQPKAILCKCIIFFSMVLCLFRFFQPHLFINLITPNPDFIKSLKTLSSFNNPTGWFPPAVQWISKTKLIYPVQNILFWGLGLPFSSLVLFSLKTLHNKKLTLVIIFWIILLTFYQGMQFSFTMRYFLPIYPYLCIFCALGYSHLKSNLKIVSLFLGIVYTVSFLNIYLQPHSRVQASIWINKNLPNQSTLSYEYWDDPLPLPMINQTKSFNSTKLALFDPDSPAKWLQINQTLNQVDYLVMSSNRLWASIPTAAKLYPKTVDFYHNLFDNQLSFWPIYHLSVYPGFPLPIKNCIYFGPSNYPYRRLQNKWLEVSICSKPGIYLRDDTAEEAFTVYDHPQVLIFKHDKSITL